MDINKFNYIDKVFENVGLNEIGLAFNILNMLDKYDIDTEDLKAYKKKKLELYDKGILKTEATIRECPHCGGVQHYRKVNTNPKNQIEGYVGYWECSKSTCLECDFVKEI